MPRHYLPAFSIALAPIGRNRELASRNGMRPRRRACRSYERDSLFLRTTRGSTTRIDTDPNLARKTRRGTDNYKVPSLKSRTTVVQAVRSKQYGLRFPWFVRCDLSPSSLPRELQFLGPTQSFGLSTPQFLLCR